MPANMIKVAIIEDDHDIRQSLGLIIHHTEGFECQQCFESCEAALEALAANPPHVVLMDINLPGMTGIEGAAILKKKHPHTDIMMLTIREDDQAVFDSLCAGATGYLLKNTPPAQLLQAIKELHAGGSPMSSHIARKVLLSFRPQAESPLSARETEILGLLCEGHHYKRIAEQLFVSGHTVRSHIKNIYYKLQVNSRAEAVRKATKDKLI